MVDTTPSPFRSDLLEGKRILITGGGTGLGRGEAKHFVDHGAEVHITGRRLAVLEEAAEEISASRPGSVHVHTMDVRRPDQVEATVDGIWKDHGPLTSVLNNAAANFIAQTKDLSPRAIDAVIGTVLNGSLNTTLAVGRRWIADGLKGTVLSNLTTWIWTGSAFVVPSAIGKAGVHAMTMSLAVEWAKYGIRINALAPGPIPTDYAWSMLNPTEKSSVGATQFDLIPAGRGGTIAELANLTMFLFSDACDYLTGQTIVMDGGQMLAGPGTFAGLNTLDDSDWEQIREASKAATAATKAQRTV
ncbi:SDR family oxidoreductase [soil metagenome]